MHVLKKRDFEVVVVTLFSMSKLLHLVNLSALSMEDYWCGEMPHYVTLNAESI